METTNLIVRYNDALPEIDFNVFLLQMHEGITNKEALRGCKGEAFKELGQSTCLEYLWEKAMEYATPVLKDFNGWTKAWYIEEFLRRCGFTYESVRGERRICYNGKPIE